jgi:hypothetical protein
VPGNGAEVGVVALLRERDDDAGRLARWDQRGLLAVDLEVVGDKPTFFKTNATLPGAAIVVVESLKKNSPPLTWTVVELARAPLSLCPVATGAMTSTPIANAAMTERVPMRTVFIRHSLRIRARLPERVRGQPERSRRVVSVPPGKRLVGPGASLRA